MNVPVAAAALLAIALLMPESRMAPTSRLDGAGVILISLALSAGGLVAVTYGVIQAGQSGWGSSGAIVPMVIGGLALAGFVLWERRLPAHHGDPLIDLRLFRSSRFTWGTVLATIVSFALFGLLFAMPQYFQNVMGVTPFGSGMRTLPFIGGFVVGAALASRLSRQRVPARGVGGVGPAGWDQRRGGHRLRVHGHRPVPRGDDLNRQYHPVVEPSLWFVIAGFGLGFALPATMNAALGAALSRPPPASGPASSWRVAR